MVQESENDPTTTEMATKKRSSVWKTMANKLGLDVPTVLMMFKGAVAPTVGVAIYQNTHVADHFSTIGYLIPIMSILTVPVMPRARFLQNLLVTCLLVCLAAALSLLAMWCAVKARENTTHIPKEATANGPVPGAAVSPFNAAASVNMAIWFFFWVWLANTFRAYRPQYFLPSILFSVFINVTGVYGTQFATMDQAESLVNRLLQSFFSGFGISFATNLLVLPVTSRTLVSMLMKEELHSFKKVFKAHTQYILSFPTRNWYGNKNVYTGDGSVRSEEEDTLSRLTAWPEADSLKKITAEISELQVKIRSELRYVKREVAWGKLGAYDFEKICDLMKNILLPVLGMESLTRVTDRIESRGGWGAMKIGATYDSLDETDLATLEEKEKTEWLWMFEMLRGRVRQLQQAMMKGIDHALYTLELAKRPKPDSKTDIESNGPNGTAGERLEQIMQEFLREREGFLKEWCASKGMDDFSQEGNISSNYPLLQRHQSQLYLFLDLEYSFLMATRGVLELVRYADSKVQDGTMSKNRLIYPSRKEMVKWFWAAIGREDNNLDYQSYSTRSGSPRVRLHDAFEVEKDTEHLPPTTVWEKLTDKLRLIPKFFGSLESAFGFRVAVATMCISIVAYLRNSQQFFIEQRLIWGSIIVAISMTQTAGSGIYGQFLRFAGTAIAMVASYIDWYIVDQHTAGIIVFLGITMFLYHYPLIKFPGNPVVPMIGMVTVVLIVGYELQVKQVGIAISVSNGQVYHPLYELAPYRLAAVLGGIGVAFFFTYFPSVVTTRSMLRKDLASSLYILGNYYSAVHQTILLRIHGAEGNPADKQSPGRKLDRARSLLFSKELILLQGIKQHCAFTAWEPSVGGKFPRAIYDELIHHTQNIMQFITMICYVTEPFDPPIAHPDIPGTSDTWVQDFRQLIASLQRTSQSVTSLLSVIAAAISTGKPLPPYLQAPPPVQIRELLDHKDADILSIKHVGEPGYAALAVMQVATAMLNDDLHGLLTTAKKLVGEAKFSIEGIMVEESETDIRMDDITTRGMRQD